MPGYKADYDRRYRAKNAAAVIERCCPSARAYRHGCRCPDCREANRQNQIRYREERAQRERQERLEAARKKMLRREIVQELQRRGVEYVPRSNAQNLDDAMRPVRFPGEVV